MLVIALDIATDTMSIHVAIHNNQNYLTYSQLHMVNFQLAPN